MKKLLIATLLLAGTISAQAVALSWSGNTTATKLLGLTAGTDMTTGTGSETASIIVYYLDYSKYDTVIGLGAVEASEISDYSVTTAKGQVAANANAAGRFGTSATYTGKTTSGDTYWARIYADFGGKTYFMDAFGGSDTAGTWTTTKSGDSTIQEKFAWAGSFGGSTSTTVGTKNAWVAVPEPSTAALALAGLALLLKRRKA